MNIVLDTNVVVSGIMTPSGPPGRIIDLVTTRRVTLLFDDRILQEYADVLTRPRLKLSPAATAAFVGFVEDSGILVPAPPLALTLPDPDDLPFLEVAQAAAADALVTGNQRHFVPASGTHDVQVLSPAAFLERWIALRG